MQASEVAIVPAEQPDELTRLETVIERGFKTFIEVGEALATIREKKLYKLRYATFEDYCTVRWKFTRQRAYQLMSAAQVAIGLSTSVTIPNEAIARQFARLENPEHQRAAAMLAIATAPEGKITASWVESTIDVMQDVENTGGFVDIGKRFAAFDAAITNEEHQKMLDKKRQVSESKQQPVTVFVSDGYDLRGIEDRIEGFDETKRYRIVIYEVTP